MHVLPKIPDWWSFNMAENFSRMYSEIINLKVQEDQRRLENDLLNKKEEDSTMTTIQKITNLKPREAFSIKGFIGQFTLSDGDCLMTKPIGNLIWIDASSMLPIILNHPELIVRFPSLNNEQSVTLSSLHRLKFKYICMDANRTLYAYSNKPYCDKQNGVWRFTQIDTADRENCASGQFLDCFKDLISNWTTELDIDYIMSQYMSKVPLE